MATKTLKVKQIAMAYNNEVKSQRLCAVVEDGSVWQYDFRDAEWIELPEIEVEDDGGGEE